MFDHSTYAVAVLLAMTTYGIAVSRRSRKRTAAEYFLGSRSIGAFSTGSSLFVTSVLGMWLLGALEGGGQGTSIAVLYGALTIVFVMVLGLYFAPLYLQSRASTVPEFVSFRFNNITGVIFSVLAIIFSIGVKIPLVLMFANWAIRNVLGWNMLTSAGLIVVVMSTGLYAIMGGFTSVVRTHILQAGVVLAGAIVVGGWTILHPGHNIEPAVTPSIPDLPLSILIGLPILFASHWWADQYNVQRILASDGIRSARGGAFVAATLMTALLMVLLACAAVSGTSPVTYMLGASTWLREIGSVIFIALLMATLANDFHSTATLFTMDIFRAVSAKASEESLVLVGRLSTTLIVVIAILVVSTVSLVDIHYLTVMQQVQAHVAPPLLAVLVFGVLWERVNSAGALWALAIGESLGACDFLIRFLISIGALRSGALYAWGSMDLFSLGIISFAVSIGVLVLASIATRTPSTQHHEYTSPLRRKQG